MSRYEVWKKEDVGSKRGMPAKEHYTLDEAMRTAKDLSKGSRTQQVWDSKKKDPAMKRWGGGGYVDVDIPNSYAVVQRVDGPSLCRGWAVGGQWYDARDCKRCKNTGNDVNSPQEPCSSCRGSSYKPKI